MTKSIKPKIKLFFVCLGLTIFSLFLHVIPINNTMLNYVENENIGNNSVGLQGGYLNWAVNFHDNFPDFRKRPTTTFLIKQLAKSLGVKNNLSFVIVNFTFLFCSGILLYYLAKLYRLSDSEALVSVVFYMASFSVLLAYFIPIMSYDESIQYFFIFLSLIGLKKKNYPLFIFSITIAIITRESTLILFPGFLLYISPASGKVSNWIKVLFILAIPVFIYVIYLLMFFGNNQDVLNETQGILKTRFLHYERNFRNIGQVTQTLLSMFSVLCVPLFLLLYKPTFLVLKREKNAFWITLIINTIIVLLSVYAEESRVFALPLIFLIPFYGKIILSYISYSKIKLLIKPINLFIILLVIFASWYGFGFLYKITPTGVDGNVFREYNTMAVMFITTIIIFSNSKTTS